jgi:hypothetical protein
MPLLLFIVLLSDFVYRLVNSNTQELLVTRLHEFFPEAGLEFKTLLRRMGFVVNETGFRLKFLTHKSSL